MQLDLSYRLAAIIYNVDIGKQCRPVDPDLPMQASSDLDFVATTV